MIRSLFVRSAAVACGLLMAAGCASAPKSQNAELNARIAYLEARLAETEQTRRQESETEAARAARIDAQLNQIVGYLGEVAQKQAPAPTPPPAPTPAVAPTASATNAPAPAPTPAPVPVSREPLVLRSPDFQFQGNTGTFRKLMERLRTRYATDSELEPAHHRAELVGKPLPQSRFIGPDGSIVDLRELQGKKRLVLVILRGFPGFVCPACSAQTIALSKKNAEFASRDAQVVLVYPGAAESVAAFVDSLQEYQKQAPLPFPILLDVNLGAVKAFGIEGSLAKPTTAIVDRAGIVRFAYVGESYDDRPSVSTILTALDGIDDRGRP